MIHIMTQAHLTNPKSLWRRKRERRSREYEENVRIEDEGIPSYRSITTMTFIHGSQPLRSIRTLDRNGEGSQKENKHNS